MVKIKNKFVLIAEFLLVILIIVSVTGTTLSEPYIYCLDGTQNRTCSTLNPPLYCDNGNLVFDVTKCGANAGKCCQSTKNPALNAVFLAINILVAEDCSNAYKYFNETIISDRGGWINPGWINNSFYEKPGIAVGIGGYPTNIQCREMPFVVEPNHGTRYKTDSCIFVPWSNEGSDRLQQVAVIDWGYSANSFCKYNGMTVEPVKVEFFTFYNISLYKGWNLISFPLKLKNKSIKDVFKNINFKSIFSYGSWHYYFNETNNNFNRINESKGYWINSLENQILTIEGHAIENPEIKLNVGWNLIGYPSLNESFINKTLKEINYSIVYAYNGSWSSYIPNRGFNSLQTLKPGYGYWVKTE